MIPVDAFAPDVEQIKRLRQLLPEDEELLALMKKEQKKVQKKEREGIWDKSFKGQDFEKIKEWLRI
jgi:hypothetical protein